MIQLRLTVKAAKAFKVPKLSIPQITEHPLDDWYIDFTTINRKRCFLVMHMQSRVALCISVSQIGGASKLLDMFPSIISHYFDDQGEHNLAKLWNGFTPEGSALFNLVKPKNLSIVAHMTQFKNLIHIKFSRNGNLSKDTFTPIATSWNHYIINIPGSNKDYQQPLEHLKSLMPELSNDRLSNVIYCNFKSKGAYFNEDC